MLICGIHFYDNVESFIDLIMWSAIEQLIGFGAIQINITLHYINDLKSIPFKYKKEYKACGVSFLILIWQDQLF